MYELVILAQLMAYPAHGYLIAKIINDIIGPYARLSSGRLYPLLAKLEQNGLIVVDTETQSGQRGDRHLRIYKITEAGRLRFHLLMRDTSSNPGDYHELFRIKVTAFEFISPVERLRLIDHYIHYCQAHIHHLHSEIDAMWRDSQDYPQLVASPYRTQCIIDSMEHSIVCWQLEQDWARSLHTREHSLANQAATDDSSSSLETQ
jgi:DNA-binding PadR family transcriptional regulator